MVEPVTKVFERLASGWFRRRAPSIAGGGVPSAEWSADCAALREIAAGLDRLEAAWNQARESVKARERGYFSPDEDDLVRGLWLAYRNYRLALYEIMARGTAYEEHPDQADRLRAFIAGYAAALLLCDKSLKLIKAYEHEPLVRDKLNEPDQRFGLEAGCFDAIARSYTSLVNQRLLVQAGRHWKRNRRAVRRLGLESDPQTAWLCELIGRQRVALRQVLWQVVRERLRFDRKALWKALRQPVGRVQYGLQSFVGATFSGLRTTLHYRPAIGDAQLAELRQSLRIGDVLLVRSERKVTTAILPGFWAHAAMFVADRDGLRECGLADVPHVERQLDSLSAKVGPFGAVIEAISPGVLINPLEACLHADHVIALRPNLEATEIRSAVADAFSHIGKPYDFEFDFNVTTRLVCTELVYRCYHRRGPIDLPLIKRLGRYTLSGDDIMSLVVDSLAALPSARPFEPVSLLLQAADGKARFVPGAETGDMLRRIQSGFRPSEAW